MGRDFFLETERVGFSKWRQDDIALASLLWGDPAVSRYICAGGVFRADDIINRLHTEIQNETLYHVQYWPVFASATDHFIGCCGLRPYPAGGYELGFHLRPEFWGKGYAAEAAHAVITYAFADLKAEKLFAGHHPDNHKSQKLLQKLGFLYIGDEFYEPTGLYHPSYVLESHTRA